MRDTFCDIALEIMKEDEDVLLMTGDLGFGVFNKIREEVPGQFYNAGVAEQNMTGMAAGLALEGHTVFTYSIGNFPTLRCLEQIRNDAAYHDANVKIVCIGGGLSYGSLGMSHHATEDLGIMRSLPEIKVFAPGCAWETEQIVRRLKDIPGTCYLRLDKSNNPKTGREEEVFDPFKARRLREGKDITLMTTGGLLYEAQKAAESLSAQGIECRVVSVPCLSPLDVDEIEACSRETGGIVTIEENNIMAGLGGAVAEVALESEFRPKVFKRIGMPNKYSSVVGTQEYLRDYYKLSAPHIEDIVKHLVG